VGGACGTHGIGEKSAGYNILVGKRPLGRPRHRSEDGMRIYLGWRVVEWIIWLRIGIGGGLL
jgi:hypothetical protein